MAKKQDKELASSKELRTSLLGLNTLAKKVLGMANGRLNSERDQERQSIKNEIESVIRKDLTQYSDVEGKDLSTLLARFVTKEVKGSNRNKETEKFDIEDIFENESNGILANFQERYRNQNLQFEDLHIIKKQIRELTSAVNVTRDAILSSDDITATVSRSISFNKENVSDDDTTGYMKEIERLEEQYDLPKKLKNHIVPNSLTFGNYYVYTIPYKEIFSKHMYKKMTDGHTSISATRESFVEQDLFGVLENFNIADDENKEKAKEYLETANAILDSVEVLNEDIPLPLLEAGFNSMFKSMSEKDLDNIANLKSETQVIKDNVKDDTDVKDKDLDFSEFSGCYMELIDPRKIIPIKILNKVIGYYYVHEERHKRVRAPFTTNFNVDMSLNAKDVESDFIFKLTEKIVKDFDKKFLEENAEFKETIMNAIMYHNIYNKDIKFQFIPAKYITEFPVNMDAEGNGQSILIDALFYAKLYLALLIFKMISIIARSNDQRLYFIRTSGMDKDVTNAVQDIVRQMKQREVNFNDLLNYKSIVSKVGAGRDIYMPVGPDDLRGIDFDTMAGQDVQLNSDLMDMLKTSAINATDVPSVMMQYINEADYARTLEMGNARFAGTVAGYQIDYNRAITELYRKLVIYSESDIPEEVAQTLVYSLSTPSALQTTNLNNLLNEIQQEIDFINKAMIGTNSNPTELENIAMDILTKRIAKRRAGSIRWDAIQEMMESVMIEAKERQKKKKEMTEQEE